MPQAAAPRAVVLVRSAQRAWALIVAALVLATPLAAQKADSTAKQTPPPEAKDKFANRRLAIGALGSQKVIVLPFAAVLVSDSAMTDTAAMRRWRDPAEGQAMANAAFTQALTIRAPEVSWILPDETRRMVKRAAGLLPEADRLGQVMLLRNGAKTLPDPLRAHLRTLSAMGSGRYALVPGGLVFRADTAGTTRVVMTLVVGDPRTGDVLWRTHAYGRGRTAEAALRAALDVTLPPEPTQP